MSSTKDLKNNVAFEPSIEPQTAAADITGVTVDIRGYDSATLFGFIDATAVGSFKLLESDASASGFSDVSADDLITDDADGLVAGVTSDIISIGYVGTKRYLRAFWDHTTGGEVAAGIVLGTPNVAPTGANS